MLQKNRLARSPQDEAEILLIDFPAVGDTRQLAAALKVSPSHLEHQRLSGEGPRFIKIGKSVRYLKRDVERWLESLTRRSTSDPGETRIETLPAFRPVRRRAAGLGAGR